MPARAQDLIPRHRVRGYRVGDLDRHYPALEVDEERLYAYGRAPAGATCAKALDAEIGRFRSVCTAT